MDELKRRAAQLDTDVKHLSTNTEANTAALVEVKKAVQRDRERNDRDRKATIAAMLAGLLLLLGVGFVAFRAEQTARDQEVLRAQVICPILARSIGGYRPETRDLNPDGSYKGSERELYDENDKANRRSYQLLRCTDPYVPPATPGV